MPQKQKKVLVAGATGVVGLGAMKHFASQGVETVAVSRRRPSNTFGAHHVSLDLTDADAAKAFAEQHSDATHIVYTALFEKPGLVAGWLEADQIATNDRMLRNFLTPILARADRLQHITLLQGTKAYGPHVRPMDIPAREDRSELEHDNFYWVQEAFIREVAQGAPWSWTIFRPQLIVGEAVGAAMNLIPIIGIYAALLKAKGEPLHYPGLGHTIQEAVDADLLARAIAWSGETDAAANQIFNITNGDVFSWRHVWPAIADVLGMEPGEERPLDVSEWLEGQVDEWRELALREGLAEPELGALLGESHHYLDMTMKTDRPGYVPPSFVSTIKLRQAGFTEVMDTEKMFVKWFRILQENRVLPG